MGWTIRACLVSSDREIFKQFSAWIVEKIAGLAAPIQDFFGNLSGKRAEKIMIDGC